MLFISCLVSHQEPHTLPTRRSSDPLNQPADRTGSVLENGVVRTPPGFRQAYRRYVEAGWMGLQCDPDYGGQGLPMSLATAIVAMWNWACMSWALCPVLNFGSIEL